MKYLYSIFFVVLVSNSTIAQYIISNDAPLNEIPVKYKLEHFKLKGSVKEYKSVTETYKFNKEGYLINYNNGTSNQDYIYNSNNKLIKIKSETSMGIEEYQIEMDSNNRIIKKGEDSFIYDSNGNVIKSKSWMGTFLYSYDNKGRLIKREMKSSFNSNMVTFTYEKDGKFIKTTSDYGKKKFKLYYKNGYNYGADKKNRIKFDKKGNPLYLIDTSGNKITDTEKIYVYF